MDNLRLIVGVEPVDFRPKIYSQYCLYSGSSQWPFCVGIRYRPWNYCTAGGSATTRKFKAGLTNSLVGVICGDEDGIYPDEDINQPLL